MKITEIEVSEEEFVRLFMEETGQTEEKAKFYAYVAKELGASAKIGDKMVKIK